MRNKSYWQLFIESEYINILLIIFSLLLTFTVGIIRPIAFIIFIPALFVAGWRFFHSFFQVVSLSREQHIPIVILIGQGSNKAKSMISEVLGVMKPYKFDLNLYSRYFQIEQIDFLLHHRIFLSEKPDEWKNLIIEFKGLKENLEARLPGNRFFHLFILAPNAFALGAGAVTGRFANVFLYHYFPPYREVVRMVNQKGARILEDPPDEFKYIKGTGTYENCDEVVISINATSIDIKGDAKSLCEKLQGEGKNVSCYHLTTNDGKSPEGNYDLVLLCREILTLIRKASEGKKRTHLLLSAHMPLSFLIGMGLGASSSSKITVYQKMKDGQYPVLELDKLIS